MSERWVQRLESVGALPVSDELRNRLHGLPESEARKRRAGRQPRKRPRCAREAGFAGIVLMGLRFDTVVGEAYEVWHTD